MARQTGLGKGLNALIGEGTFEDFSSSGVTLKEEVKEEKKLPPEVSVDENGTLWMSPINLKPNPKQPRIVFDQEKLDELVSSVKKEGVLSPVIVEHSDDGNFYIIAGERRTRAALQAGLEKIPVQFRKYSDVKKLEIALIENIQRTDLNPLEEAQAYKHLMEMAGLSQEEVSDRVGKKRSTVANALRLLRLPQEIQEAVVSDSISSGHARAILSLDNQSDMNILFNKIIKDGLSVRQAEALAKEIKNGKVIKPPIKKDESNIDPNLSAIEQKVRDRLGTKVRIKGSLESGNITIDYFSSSDLDRIFNIIVPEASL